MGKRKAKEISGPEWEQYAKVADFRALGFFGKQVMELLKKAKAEGYEAEALIACFSAPHIFCNVRDVHARVAQLLRNRVPKH